MFNKRQISLIACCFFIMLGFVVNSVVFVRDHSDKKNMPNLVEQSVVSSKNIMDKELGKKAYIVKIYRGNIAVFDASNPDTPMHTTDISQDTLRVYDKEQLEKGLTVYGEDELSMILEDFGS